MANAIKVGPLTVREWVVKGKPSGKWVVIVPSSLSSTGKRVRKLFRSRQDAERIARDVARELNMKRLGFAQKSARINLSFSDAADQWLKSRDLDLSTKKLTSSTMRTINIRLRPLKAYFGRYSVSDIGSDDISRYQRDRLKENRKAITINGETRVLRQVFGWLVDKGVTQAIPKFRAVPEEYVRYEVPSMEKVADLVRALSPANRALVRLMAETGLRPGEARTVPWVHLDAERKRIWIGPFKDWSPKTKASRRFVMLQDDLLADLLALPRSSIYLFPGRDPSKPVQNIRAALDTASEQVGLGRVRMKLFRKAFATWQAERGLHPGLLQNMMGHVPGSSVTEQHYIFASETAKRNAGFSLPLPEGKAA